MKSLIRDTVAGTWVESPARWVWRRLRPHAVTSEPLDREDAWTVEIMSRVLKPDSNCVDVGCARGKILAHMERFAPSATHFAFEPLPHAAQKLRRRHPRTHVFEMALGDAAGESDFQHVVTNPGYSGLRRREYPTNREKVETIRVRVDKLDSVLPQNVPIRLIKIDVEGGELQVLRGAEATLRRERPYVVFEHGKGAAEYYGTTPEQVYDLLTECGLQISLLPDWLAGQPPLQRVDFASHFGGQHWYFLAHR